MITALLAAALATSAPVVAPFTGDVFKDLPQVCAAESLDKLDKAVNGEEVTSDVVDFYIEVFKLDADKASFLTHSCAMYETGFTTGFLMARPSPIRPRLMEKKAPTETQF